MYAKLENGRLKTAPKKVNRDDKTIFNPPDSILSELGYYPVTYTDMPTDASEGKHYEFSWSQGENEILQVWNLVDDLVYPETEAETTISDLEDAVERGIES